MMIRTFPVFAFLVVTSPINSAAQTVSSPSADEVAIRELIAHFDKGKSPPATKDHISWTGPYRQPTIGDAHAPEVGGSSAPSNRVPGSTSIKTTVVRLEIAKSGDLAYEFSNSELSFEVKGGEKRTTMTSALRVWKKEAGQWKLAAIFARPHVEAK